MKYLKGELTALALIVILGFWIRVAGVEWGLPSKSLTLASYHPDEAFLFQTLEHMYKTRSLSPPEIALHYGTLHFYISGAILAAAKGLGLVQIGSREFLQNNLSQADRMYLIIRYFSVFCGILSILGVYILAKRIYGKTEALWSAFIMGFTPTGIAISHYAKLDSLLPPLILLLLWFCLDLLDNPTSRLSWICGILTGLLASTRYNCGTFLLAPLAALFIKRRDCRMISRSLETCAGALIAFLVTTPYSILDFPLFFKGLNHIWGFVGAYYSPVYYSHVRDSRIVGLYQVIFDMIPFGAGWIVLILFLAGCFAEFRGGLHDAEKILLLGLVSFLGLVWISVTRYSYYIAPVLPILALFASCGAETLRKRLAPVLQVVVFSTVLLIQAGYCWSFARLYIEPNPREMAGQWLKINVSPRESVGIIRSYFWTPGILRQKTPPYTLYKGGDDLSDFGDAVLGLGKMKVLPDWFLMSDLEQRNLERYSREDPACGTAFSDFMSHYKLAQTFELEPVLFGVRFWRREVPWDLKTPAPSIHIFKKI